MTRPLNLMIIAGEVSGDMHAGPLLQALREKHPDLQCFGIGGDALRAAGTEVLVDAREMAVMGLTEVLLRIFFFRRVFARMRAEAARRRPDAVILVDYPGFNLRFARCARQMGLKVIYFICPQVWAWNRGRIPRMAQIVDRLIAIFPFEPDVFKSTPLRVDFVGHPLVDEAARAHAQPLPDLPWAGSPRIALLPGSRRHEITRILPILLKAAVFIQQRHPDAAFLIPYPSREAGVAVRSVLGSASHCPVRCGVVEGAARQVLRTARAALVASGTATLESALMRCPTVIAYRVSPLTYGLGRILVRVPFIGIVNIIAGRRICPEFLQQAATPQALTDAILPLLEDGPARQSMLDGLAATVAQLGTGGAVDRAAAIVLEEVGRSRQPA